jgi:hypothetical protein
MNKEREKKTEEKYAKPNPFKLKDDDKNQREFSEKLREAPKFDRVQLEYKVHKNTTEKKSVIEKIKAQLKQHPTLSILSLFISEFALIQTTTNILLSITPPGVVGAIVTEAFVISEAIALALLNIPIIDDLLQPEPSW